MSLELIVGFMIVCELLAIIFLQIGGRSRVESKLEEITQSLKDMGSQR
jgi:hypothetical protein